MSPSLPPLGALVLTVRAPKAFCDDVPNVDACTLDALMFSPDNVAVDGLYTRLALSVSMRGLWLPVAFCGLNNTW